MRTRNISAYDKAYKERDFRKNENKWITTGGKKERETVANTVNGLQTYNKTTLDNY